MKTFLTFLCCFFTVAFSLPAQTLLEGYVRDMECCGISEAVVTVMRPGCAPAFSFRCGFVRL